MANTLDPNDIVEVTCFGTYDLQTIINTFHFRYAGAAIPAGGYTAEMNAMMGNFRSVYWTAHWRAAVVSGFTLNAVRGQKVGPAAGVRGYYVQQTVNESGLVGAAGCPADTQLCISYSTDRAFKGASGGKHFAGIPLTGQANSLWLIGTRATWTTVAGDLTTPIAGTIGGNLFTPVVWSPRATRRMTPGNIIGVRVRDEVRTQHSRTVGRGI